LQAAGCQLLRAALVLLPLGPTLRQGSLPP
jgi:hypothetical protein